MFSSDGEKPIRDTLIKAYNILEEIYDDLLTPVRLKQVVSDQVMFAQDMAKLKLINQTISRDRSLEEIKYPFTNLNLLRKSEKLYSHYATHVLSIDAYRMTETQYRSALTGLPLYEGALQHNSQILLKNKIDKAIALNNN